MGKSKPQQGKRPSSSANTSIKSGATKGDDDDDNNNNNNNKLVNKPRNLMVTDATTPLQFAWTGMYRIHHCLTLNQTEKEETWPGGAIWDCGWCLAQLLIGIAAAATASSSSSNTTTATATETAGVTSTTTTTHLQKSAHRTIHLPPRVLAEHRRLRDASPLLILELGCGVGLAGLVAAAAFQARAVVLTDLPVVVERVTQPNVLLNTTLAKKSNKQKVGAAAGAGGTTAQQQQQQQHHQRRIINKGHSQVIATPLGWGNPDDERAVAALLRDLDQTTTSSHQQSPKGKGRKKKGIHNKSTTAPCDIRTPGTPDLIIIGDVAYQHGPGAPSHFDALASTLLKFAVDDHTLVLFGTRIRMPASVDLTDLLLEHFDSAVEPVLANEIEPTAFASIKQNNMGVYFLRRKQKQQEQNAEVEISSGCTESKSAECE